MIGLLLLSPVCAEYLWGYDTSTGDPVELVGGLLIFVPLYGASALLIREVARRLGLGWRGILLLAAAGGLVQAGIVDQSMFSTSYRDIPYWDDITQPTFIAPLGVSVYTTLNFVGGHVVMSFGAPIAVVEGLAGPARERLWLGRIGLGVAALAYLGAGALVLGDHLSSEADHASATQLAVSGAVVAALVGLALLVGDPLTPVDRPAPRPWQVLLGAAALTSPWTMLPPSPAGTVGLELTIVLGVVGTTYVSRSAGWGAGHVAALAGGALVAVGAGAFFTDPLGAVAAPAKYAHNVVLLALVAGLALAAARRPRTAAGGALT